VAWEDEAEERASQARKQALRARMLALMERKKKELAASEVGEAEEDGINQSKEDAGRAEEEPKEIAQAENEPKELPEKRKERSAGEQEERRGLRIVEESEDEERRREAKKLELKERMLLLLQRKRQAPEEEASEEASEEEASEEEHSLRFQVGGSSCSRAALPPDAELERGEEMKFSPETKQPWLGDSQEAGQEDASDDDMESTEDEDDFDMELSQPSQLQAQESSQSWPRDRSRRPLVPDSDSEEDDDMDDGDFLSIVRGLKAQFRGSSGEAEDREDVKQTKQAPAFACMEAEAFEAERKEAAKRTLELMEARRMVDAAIDASGKRRDRKKRNNVNKRCDVHQIRQKMDEELAVQERGPRYVNNVAVFVKKGQKDIDAKEADALVKKEEQKVKKGKKAKDEAPAAGS